MNDAKSPILNNPYEEPLYHYDTTLDGNLDYTRILEGRRPYMSNLNILPEGGQRTLLSGSMMGYDPDKTADFINGIRALVREWRAADYPHVTRVTRDLLNFWFRNPERELNQSLFFCQREAVETAVYLNEVAPRDFLTKNE